MLKSSLKKHPRTQLCSRITLPLFLLCLVFFIPACQKLDKDGGYYDETSKTYKYVNITRKGVKKSSLQVSSPTPGKLQHVQGIVTRIENDAKSIWLKIKDRQPYMILAERLSGGNRNDKKKEIRIQLKYVSPLGSVTLGSNFRKKWRPFVQNRLGEQILNKSILVEIDYTEPARKLWGTVFTVVETAKGERVRNINLWMVQQGLSYYFIDHGQSPENKNFKAAQTLARQSKNGLWKYQ